MVLIIGGAYQGKTAYAQTKYALRDAETREWREAVGRMNAALAAQADTVTRIFCGLPLELKG